MNLGLYSEGATRATGLTGDAVYLRLDNSTGNLILNEVNDGTVNELARVNQDTRGGTLDDTFTFEVDFANGTVSASIDNENNDSFSTGPITTSAGVDLATATWSSLEVAGMADANANFPRAQEMSLTAVPETSTYALIFGAVALAGVMVRRRKA